MTMADSLERGTLEVTLWPARRRLWMSVHANRGAEWVEGALRHLADALPGALRYSRCKSPSASAATTTSVPD